MARYRRFLNSLQQSFIALFKAIAGLFVKAARQTFIHKRHRRQSARFPRFRQAGFVLPTTALILVVLGLVVAALLIRTSTRMEEVIVARQTQEIENAASPAIDRARAKLQKLFAQDDRLPAGVPNENVLASLMRNDGTNNTVQTNANPYDLPNETRLDLDGDGSNDNAWVYQDGNTTIAYSIIMQTPTQLNTLAEFGQQARSTRAGNLQVRHGPLATQDMTDRCAVANGGTRTAQGWFRATDNQGLLFKNFQINAIAFSGGGPQAQAQGSVGTISTIETQQDRAYRFGNTWGAWFRNDLEIHPGPQMNWNGAMHTDGNLMIGNNIGNNSFTSYLVSAPSSCIFDTRLFSDLTMNEQGGQFLGQFALSYLERNAYNNDDTINIHSFNNAHGHNTNQINMNSDSVVNNNNSAPSDLAVDPVVLFTQDQVVSRNQAPLPANNPRWARDPQWDPQNLNNRIFNSLSPTPRIDDFYRADDRLGPKASYDGDRFVLGQNTSAIGGANLTRGNLPNNDVNGAPIDSINNTNDLDNNPAQANPPDPNDFGFDGYWERRARNEGLRVIVGERLELEDPGLFSPSSTHQDRQRATLQDKLGAAQATLFYHYTNQDANNNIEDFPVAAMVSTVHPGTGETLKRSATFEQMQPAFNVATPGGGIYTNLFGNQFGNNNNEILVDFFTGRGTNGWEFTTSFNSSGTNLFSAGTGPQGDLLVALENLAEFAGDPDGAFPPVQGGNIHPYPLMTKWGNFSDLRRALTNMSGNGAPLQNNLNNNNYSGLSIADKSTIQSASFMLGMLAYNISYLNAYDYTNGGANAGNQQGLINLDDSLANNGINNSRQPEQAIQAIPPNQPVLKNLARLIALKEQINFDRNNGNNYTCAMMRNPQPAWLGTVLNNDNDNTNNLQSLCPADRNNDGNMNASDVKYPALYYIFPTTQHGEPRNDAFITNANNASNQPYQQMTNQQVANIALMPRALNNWTLPYATNVPTTGGNIGANQCHNDALPNCSQIEVLQHVTPAAGGGTNTNNLRVAFKDSALFNGREQMSVRVLNMDLDMLRNDPNLGTLVNGAPFTNSNGRNDTWLAAGTPVGVNPSRDGGIVYAFREDAVREDEIARPSGNNNWGNCNTAATITNCANTANSTNQTDPPLNPNTDISPKSVDFYPDPDRRPYGFRVKHGEDLRRDADDDGNVDVSSATPADPAYGLSLISDNPVYIQGDFNLHQNNNGSLEEFQDQLNTPGWGNFYDRDQTEPCFATPRNNQNNCNNPDQWRPSEILSDSVTIISNNFCDGSIEDGILATGFNRPNAVNTNAGNIDLQGLLQALVGNPGRTDPDPNDALSLTQEVYGCKDTGGNAQQPNPNWVGTNPSFPITSYLNQNIGTGGNNPGQYGNNPQFWDRENSADENSPIEIVQQGNNNNPRPSWNGNPYNGGYYGFAVNNPNNIPTGNAIMTPDTNGQTVNAVIASGIVPGRANQSYGGLHNFPRFLENWFRTDLDISGSFVQLNYSNYATGQLDADSWQPGNTPGPNIAIFHYVPPNRQWGYDVALPLQQPGPISQRLQVPAARRDEYHFEPERNDPYVNLLCQAVNCPN